MSKEAKNYQVDIHYQSFSGNECSRRFSVKAPDEIEAINLANARVRKLKNFCKSMGGDCIEIKV